MEKLLEITHLKKSFGDTEVLKDISMEVTKGEVVAILGPSGSGKSTLLHVMGGVDSPNSGNIIVDGKDLTKLSDVEMSVFRRRKIGFVFQAVALIPIMTAYENVEYALRLAGVKKGRKQRAYECLEKVGLAERMHHYPAEMSGGEQQRVAIARAICHKPKVIFADEPTAELDTMSALRVVKIFKDLIKEEGCTVVMTTHSVDLMEAADVLYELSDGKVISDRKKEGIS